MPRRASSKSTQAPASSPSAGRQQRLQKVLAAAGFGSRRQCEELIELGRVEVDGVIVTKLGTTVDPHASKIRVDGVNLKPRKLAYYAVNKPVGVVTTNRDPQGRPRVIDLVPPKERVFPVGRLDRNSEGLILLTNDGDLAQQLTHPKFGVRKVYRVTVAGRVESDTLRKMRKGIYIAEGLVRVEGARILKARPRATDLEIVLREGKNREIRRILARFGHKVQQLRRIAVGTLRLGDTPPGAYRIVTREEVQKLRREVSRADVEKKGSKKRTTKKATTKSRRGRGAADKETSPAPFEFEFGENQTVGRVIGEEGDEVATSKKRSAKKRRARKTSEADRGSKSDPGKKGRGTKKSTKKRATKKRATKKRATKKRAAKKRSTRKGGAASAARRGEGRRPAKKRRSLMHDRLRPPWDHSHEVKARQQRRPQQGADTRNRR